MNKTSNNMCVLSLDYDDCMSIFVNKKQQRWLRDYVNAYPVLNKDSVDIVVNLIDGLLDNITDGYSDVVVMCGSNRQSCAIDKYNSIVAHKVIPSGSAFLDFSEFVQERSLVDSRYRLSKVLFADNTENVKLCVGTEWDNVKRDGDTIVWGDGGDMIPSYDGIESKKKIIINQLNHLPKFVPITFNFVDDHKDYLQGVLAHVNKMKDIGMYSNITINCWHLYWQSIFNDVSVGKEVSEPPSLHH